MWSSACLEKEAQKPSLGKLAEHASWPPRARHCSHKGDPRPQRGGALATTAGLAAQHYPHVFALPGSSPTDMIWEKRLGASRNTSIAFCA
mmetsp:Transcript_11801/g.26926  ORF Transcript_11801/g.26926 Transcript_11801/m.26926 type:complete len:90 (+) Transcript_11801:172-441(+)